MVSRPSSTSAWTKVSSWVIWVSDPPRTRYARESPTCTSPTREPANSSAVSVVPIPSRFGSCSIIARRLLFAAAVVSRRVEMRSSIGRSSSRCASVEMTTLLATSPAACPPIPSASASSRGPAYTESSLLARISPRSERTAYRRATVTGRDLDLGERS